MLRDDIEGSGQGGSPVLMEVGRDVGAVLQALAVIRVIAAQGEPLVMSAISKAAGVSPSTTLNILRTLVNERIISFHPSAKTYEIGLGMLELAGPLLSRPDIELVRPELHRIATRFEATASMWMVQSGDRLVLAGRVVSDSHIHIEFRIASRLPPYAGATGTTVAAARNTPARELAEGFAKVRWANPVTLKQYLSGVAKARRSGFAVDTGRLIRGVTSVATVVCDAAGEPKLVLAMHLFQGQLSPEGIDELGTELARLAGYVSHSVYRAIPAATPAARADQGRPRRIRRSGKA